MAHKQIYYSDKYDDDKYEYRLVKSNKNNESGEKKPKCHCLILPPLILVINRHVMLPKEIAKRVPKTHLMSETEWRNLGVQQSQGWVHYMIHQPGRFWWTWTLFWRLLETFFLSIHEILIQSFRVYLCILPWSFFLLFQSRISCFSGVLCPPKSDLAKDSFVRHSLVLLVYLSHVTATIGTLKRPWSFFFVPLLFFFFFDRSCWTMTKTVVCVMKSGCWAKEHWTK